MPYSNNTASRVCGKPPSILALRNPDDSASFGTMGGAARVRLDFAACANREVADASCVGHERPIRHTSRNNSFCRESPRGAGGSGRTESSSASTRLAQAAVSGGLAIVVSSWP